MAPIHLSSGTLEQIDKLTHTLKNIHKIMGKEYSGADWEARGSYGDGYRDSYRGNYIDDYYSDTSGMHYVRGHMSRDGRSHEISRSGHDRARMINELANVMNDAKTEEERKTIRRCMAELEDL